jgi:hypothetical protein
MKRGLLILYRSMGILISLIAYMMLFFVLSAFFEIGLQGLVLIPLFIAACLVIYSVLTGMFSRMVLMLQQPIRYSLKDWIKVNAYVSVIYTGLSMIASAVLLGNQSLLKTIYQQQVGAASAITEAQLRSFLTANLIITSIIFIHCIWTLRLVKRFREYFK